MADVHRRRIVISDADRARMRQDLSDDRRLRNSDRPTQLVDFTRWFRLIDDVEHLLRENEQLRAEIQRQAAEIVRLSKAGH